MLKAMIDDAAKFVPRKGYNVVGVDDFEAPGEQLYLIGNFDNEVEAEVVRAENEAATGDATYIYRPNQR